MVNVLSKIGAVKVGHKTVNGISGKYYDISKVREQLAKDYAEEEPKWVREQQ
jgi:hypothetical protein